MKVRVNGQGSGKVKPQVKKKAFKLICNGNLDDGKTHYCPFAEEFGKKLDDLNKRLKKIELEADELDKINREFNYDLHNLKIKFDKLENSHSQLVLDFYRLKDEIEWEKDK